MLYPPPDLVARALQATNFIGLLEFYPESLCLFGYQVNRKVPPNCVDPCKRQAVRGHLNESHGYTNTVHIDDLDHETLELIDNLTTVDRTLYTAARRRFSLSAQEARISLTPCDRPLQHRSNGPAPAQQGRPLHPPRNRQQSPKGVAMKSAAGPKSKIRIPKKRAIPAWIPGWLVFY
eukprot:FR739790.1.p1 GENE.FR739790.1~~FR739790.1.p1  ORF type:complete len:201 (+),score=7.80 FR739790.1:75-605(+)